MDNLYAGDLSLRIEFWILIKRGCVCVCVLCMHGDGAHMQQQQRLNFELARHKKARYPTGHTPSHISLPREQSSTSCPPSLFCGKGGCVPPPKTVHAYKLSPSL